MAKRPDSDARNRARLIKDLKDLSEKLPTLLPALVKTRVEFGAKLGGQHPFVNDFNEIAMDIASVTGTLRDALALMKKRASKPAEGKAMLEKLYEARQAWYGAVENFDSLTKEDPVVLLAEAREQQARTGIIPPGEEELREAMIRSVEAHARLTPEEAEAMYQRAVQETTAESRSYKALMKHYEKRLREVSASLESVALRVPDAIERAHDAARLISEKEPRRGR